MTATPTSTPTTKGGQSGKALHLDGMATHIESVIRPYLEERRRHLGTLPSTAEIQGQHPGAREGLALFVRSRFFVSEIASNLENIPIDRAIDILAAMWGDKEIKEHAARLVAASGLSPRFARSPHA
jgi:hypothetical protein